MEFQGILELKYTSFWLLQREYQTLWRPKNGVYFAHWTPVIAFSLQRCTQALIKECQFTSTALSLFICFNNMGGHAQLVVSGCPWFPTSVFLSFPQLGQPQTIFGEGMMKVCPMTLKISMSHACFKTYPDLMDHWIR